MQHDYRKLNRTTCVDPSASASVNSRQVLDQLRLVATRYFPDYAGQVPLKHVAFIVDVMLGGDRPPLLDQSDGDH